MTRVLVVDDDKDMLTLLKFHFEHAGADVSMQQKPIIACREVAEQQKNGTPFDLIILDIRMPEMDGNEVAKTIRDGGYKGGLIAFTSTATGEGRKLGQEVGFDTYLSKQMLKKELVAALVEQYAPKSK